MLLDTSGLLCLHHGAELFHAQARAAYREARIRFTHGYVVAEFVALAEARRLHRLAALAFVADLLENPDIETEWVDEPLHREALSLLFARPDKAYSLCRCCQFRRDAPA